MLAGPAAAASPAGPPPVTVLTRGPGSGTGEIFAWQHDPDQVGPQTYTLFDDESSGTPLLPVSRAVTVRLDFRARTATLVASDDQPEGLVASSQGQRADDRKR